MDYFIIVVTTLAGLIFHAWLIVRFRRWADRDLALSKAGSDPQKRAWMLEQLARRRSSARTWTAGWSGPGRTIRRAAESLAAELRKQLRSQAPEDGLQPIIPHLDHRWRAEAHPTCPMHGTCLTCLECRQRAGKNRYGASRWRSQLLATKR